MRKSEAGELPDDLPAVTPLLAAGDRRWFDNRSEVELGAGLAGTYADYRYEEDDDDSVRHFAFKVVLTAVPESIGFAPRLICQPRASRIDRRVIESLRTRAKGYLGELNADKASRLSLPDRELDLESPALHERYHLAIDHDVGANWTRQLFSPSFIDWLTTGAPQGLRFELIDGALVIAVPEGKDMASREEVIAAAAEVAKRIREEPLEEAGLDTAGRAAMADRRDVSLAGIVEREAAKRPWPEPPADESTAIRAYRRVAARSVKPWLLGGGIFLAGAVAGIVALITHGDGFTAVILAALAFGPLTFARMVNRRAKAYGRVAFAQQYATSRGLERGEPRLFQARHMQLPMPGVVEEALTGTLPGGRRAATTVFLRGSGSKNEIYDGVVVEMGTQKAAAAERDFGAGLQSAVHDRSLIVTRAVPAKPGRTAAGLDDLAARVASAL